MATSFQKNKQHQKDGRGTPAEAALWEQLQKKKLDGLKFLRQYTFGPYVLDYYCADKLLAIRLDGAETSDGDDKRTSYLGERGITELHFNNKQIFEGTKDVLAAISAAAAKTPPRGKSSEEKA